MPLGGSITHGVGSSDRNGYRQCLLELLEADGFNVRMVGSRKAGTMSNNDHEGWRGFRIDQIETKGLISAERLMPNVFTINAGSNDCIQNHRLEDTGIRVGRLLKGLWQVCPDSTMILSTLLVSGDPQVDARIQSFNHRLAGVAKALQLQGKRIVFADMRGLDGPTVEDLVHDHTHPNDTGYRKMALIWRRSIRDAAKRGFL